MFDKLIQDEVFLEKLNTRLLYSKKQFLECDLEGASSLRDICRLIINLISFETINEQSKNKSTTDNNSVYTLNRNTEYSEYKIRKLERFIEIIEIPQLFLDLINILIIDKESKFCILREVTVIYSITLIFIFFTTHFQ